MRRKQAFRILIIFASIISFVLGLGAKLLLKELQITGLEKLCDVAWLIAIILIVFVTIEFLLSNHILKGFRYFWNYWTITNSLELQMIDAGFGIMRGNYIELPRIKLTFNKELSTGILKIKNHLKFNTKLDNLVMSSALHKFIVERHYQTDDGNYYIYELLDGATSFKMTFKTFDEFLEYNKTIPTYKLFFDGRSQVKLQHTLIVGQTGAGKSYSIYCFILQMLNKNMKYELYYADPKGSSLAVIGSTIAKDKTAVDVEQIIMLLEAFVEKMQERKKELRNLLESKIDADYSDFRLCPYVFIFDEYASFASIVATKDKKVRDKVSSLIYNVVLTGRQLGYFIVIILQKSDSKILDTAIRENLPLKLIYGNAENQTYVSLIGKIHLPIVYFIGIIQKDKRKNCRKQWLQRFQSQLL